MIEKAIAVDLYNQVLTGDICMTLRQKAADSDHIPCVMIKKEEPILLESNQNHATITQDGICTTLSASMGLGGGYVPMIVQEVANGRTESNSVRGEPY